MFETTLSVSVTLMHRDSRVQRLEQHASRKGRSLISNHGGLIWSGWSLSHAPQQQVVGAVVSSHGLAAAVQPEVLVAVSAADHQQSGFTCEEGGGPALLHCSVMTQL